MELLQRDFKGIWIPKEVWLDKRLNALDKIILMEIHSLDNGESGCYASNKYLADFCHCTETKVSTTISKLKEFGYIELTNFDGRHRTLKIKSLSLKNLKSDINNFKSNNIDNNINDNIDNKLSILDIEKEKNKKEYIVENEEIFKSGTILNSSLLMKNIKCIIDYLNESINANFRYDTKGTINLIKARFKEGYKLDDFYDVIDKKVKEWNNTDMQKYLRPYTLFGNKFENYLNQKTYFKGTAKTSYSSQPIFDNTKGNIKVYHISDEEFNKLTFEEKMKEMDKFDAVADMTKEQYKFFNQHCLARDENGNLYKF